MFLLGAAKGLIISDTFRLRPTDLPRRLHFLPWPVPSTLRTRQRVIIVFGGEPGDAVLQILRPQRTLESYEVIKLAPPQICLPSMRHVATADRYSYHTTLMGIESVCRAKCTRWPRISAIPALATLARRRLPHAAAGHGVFSTLVSLRTKDFVLLDGALLFLSPNHERLA